MKLASVGALDAAGVRYLALGGLAVALHGDGRVTYGLGVVVPLQPDQIRAVFRDETESRSRQNLADAEELEAIREKLYATKQRKDIRLPEGDRPVSFEAVRLAQHPRFLALLAREDPGDEAHGRVARVGPSPSQSPALARGAARG